MHHLSQFMVHSHCPIPTQRPILIPQKICSQWLIRQHETSIQFHASHLLLCLGVGQGTGQCEDTTIVNI